MATAVAKAAADAECPDGNDDEVGRLDRRRCTAIRSAAGLRRGKSDFPTRFALADAPAMAATPLSAPRRNDPFPVARMAATTNHSRLWLAALESLFKPLSSL